MPSAATSPSSVLHAVAYVGQRATWDCPVACALMICRALALTYSYADLVVQCRTTTIWTVDILLALNRCGVRAVMYTACAGADRRHEAKPFYRETFAEDAKRVEEQFAEAERLKIPVHARVLALAEIIRLIRDQSAVIMVLIDQNALEQEGGTTSESLFVGHYILLIGFQTDSHGRSARFCYLDPARPPPVPHSFSTMTPDVLDRVRKSPGTDHDALVVDITQKATMYSYYGVEYDY